MPHEDFIYCQSEIELKERCEIQCDHCKVYYRPLEETQKLQSELTRLTEENERLKGEVKKWAIALQSLTPGGSEYVDDPERCVSTVRDFQRSQHKYIVETKKDNKAKLSRIQELEQGIREAELGLGSAEALITEGGYDPTIPEHRDCLANLNDAITKVKSLKNGTK